MTEAPRAGGGPFEVCELGPLGFRTPGGWSPVRGERSAAVVAALCLAGPGGVRRDALLEYVWPAGALPPSGRQSLANVVNRLRTTVGRDVILTTGHGYRLGPAVVSDRERYLHEVATADEVVDDDPEGALGLLHRAARRWRGAPWVDVDRDDLVAGDRAHLESVRHRARTVEASALCATGRHDQAVQIAEQVLADDPTDEPVWHLLATSLAATGRRPAAIDALARARRALASHGLGTSPALAELEQRLLSGLGSSARPPRARSTLPERPAGLQGRDQLLSRLDDQLGTRRLTTLTGPGGVGKTTVAIEAAHRWSAGAPVAVVDLAPVRSHHPLDDQVATCFGVVPEAGVAPLDAVAVRVGGSRPLVVLDNCEHLVDAAVALIDELAVRCGDVTILATSRVPLGRSGERVVPVDPLGLDDSTDLFFACAADSGVALDATQWQPAVAELCHQLDGLPLAIELAARRTVALDPSEIVDALDHRFALLRDPFGSGRQSSLKATIEWSWDQLEEGQRRVLVHLAVFAEGAGVDELAEILGVDRVEALDLVQSVARQSLVRVHHRSNRPSEVLLLETIRAFVLESVDPAAVIDARDAHLEWVDRLVADAIGHMGERALDVDPLATLDLVVHEIRAALDHAGSHPPAAGRGLALAARLRPFWRGRNAAAEGVERLRDLLDTGAGDRRSRIDGAAAMATLMRLVGEDDDAITAVLDDARPLLAGVDDRAVRNHLELRLLEAGFRADDPEIALRLRRLADAARADGTTEDGMALHLLTAWTLANDPPAAAAVAEETMAAATSNTVACRAHALELLGLTSLVDGRFEEARRHLAQALDAFDSAEQPLCSVHCCESVAWWTAADGGIEPARELLTATEGVRHRHGRFRAGFEMPAIDGVVALVGALPGPDRDAAVEETIAMARALLDRHG